MAVWKKLNPETGEYEEIPNSGSGDCVLKKKDSHLTSGARTTVKIADVAVSVRESSSVGKTGNVGNASADFKVFEIENVKKDDYIFIAGRNEIEGVISDGTNPLFDKVKKTFRDNYAWASYEFVADKDYERLFITQHIPTETKYSVSTWEYAVHNVWPSYNNQFVPVVADNETNNIKTLSSEKIRADYGMDFLKAKAALSGGVWIALGDSYTEYAKSDFKALAEKYGMIYDGQGVVSSTVCGDDGGNKGFSPFWQRTNRFIANYTGNGQTIDGVDYTADDVKLITFMGGANDGFGKDTWIGSPTSMDTMYISGACNYIFRKLHENFPNARIICILQPANFSDTMNYTDDATAQILGFKDLAEMQTWDVYSFGQYKMETKERAVKACAERFGIHIVDCIFDWYSVVNPTQRVMYWNPDKIHLSSAGTTALAEKLDREGILKVFG